MSKTFFINLSEFTLLSQSFAMQFSDFNYVDIGDAFCRYPYGAVWGCLVVLSAPVKAKRGCRQNITS